MKIELKLTKAQLVWLGCLLDKEMNNDFNNNIREKNHCNNVYDKTIFEIEKLGYFSEFLWYLRRKNENKNQKIK